MPASPSHSRLHFAVVLAIVVLMVFVVAGNATVRAGGDDAPWAHKHTEHKHFWDTDAGSDLGTTDPVIAAFQAANDKMRREMAFPLTGDADRDFVASMIPHHQGAIDMAEIALRYGQDPAIRALAQEIIVAQKKEIARMKAWLAQHSR